MKKFICDICGKDIKNIRDRWYISRSWSLNIGNDSFDFNNISYDDVCTDCIEKIKQLIANIMNESGD